MPNRDEINARLPRVEIKGNPYVPVPPRVQGFWEMCPEGAITTEFLVLERDFCVCQATITVMGAVVATGTAFEERKGNINTTSYVENCETSAVGRALGFFGIGSVESIASAEEVAAAIAQQEQGKEQGKKAKSNPLEEMRAQAHMYGIKDAEIRNALVAAIGEKLSKDYTKDEYQQAIGVIGALIAERGGNG